MFGKSGGAGDAPSIESRPIWAFFRCSAGGMLWRRANIKNMPMWAWSRCSGDREVVDTHRVRRCWRHTKHRKACPSGHDFGVREVGRQWTHAEHRKHAQMACFCCLAGGNVVGTDVPLRLTFRAREGIGGSWKSPSVSRFERGRGMGIFGRRQPLHLAFQAKEGDGHSWKETAPPSRFLSEGGDQGGWKSPSVSRFERGREMGVFGKRRPPPSRVSRKGGVGDHLKCISTRRGGQQPPCCVETCSLSLIYKFSTYIIDNFNKKHTCGGMGEVDPFPPPLQPVALAVCLTA